MHQERKHNRTKIVQNRDFNLFSFSLAFGNPIRAIKGKKIEESQEIDRDATIVVGRHVSPLRDKG